ncbi:class I SAM-dependent methyltransferase [Actinotalea ferrariae]|uniref:class I SAM-dependent methyltransferase n=1 Tax=Actinotalea ferrariae TaxID=1386098 RepID=UPI001C8C5C97|nr:class I SAM-dependent methyltransferase [Actinotalea ferrariae]MBX9246684.1 class I SAM-dependent methyltransferase [Actinotalea ferrariae]
MQPDGLLDDDGERMIPAFHQGGLIYAEHYTRYLVAQELVRGKRVLDIASGSGYGSQLLAATAASVIGVDREERAVAYASATYGADNLEYRQGDATQIPVEDGSIDVVITFETIEHIEDYRAFMREIDRVLAPDGLAVISTPNDLEFAEGNHFHLHEFVLDELLELVGEHFAHVEQYFQATWKAVAVSTEEDFRREGALDLPLVNLAPLEPEQFLYFFLLCSRRPVTERIDPVVALGGHYSDRAILGREQEHVTTIQRLEAEVQRLDADLARSRADLEERENELALLRSSRALRVARGVRSAVGRVTGRR